MSNNSNLKHFTYEQFSFLEHFLTLHPYVSSLTKHLIVYTFSPLPSVTSLKAFEKLDARKILYFSFYLTTKFELKERNVRVEKQERFTSEPHFVLINS